MKDELVRYDVTWSRQAASVKASFRMLQKKKPEHDEWFDQFKLEGGKWHD
ncbi:hypothetical protein [Acidaminococcus sp. DS4831]